jgi:hypothetical protein
LKGGRRGKRTVAVYYDGVVIGQGGTADNMQRCGSTGVDRRTMDFQCVILPGDLDCIIIGSDVRRGGTGNVSR